MPSGGMLKLPLHGHGGDPPPPSNIAGNMAIGGFGRSMVTGGFN